MFNDDAIGGSRGGAAAPPFFLYFQNVLRFCFENRFIKCSLFLSSEALTLLYFASRIHPQCCMLHVLKSEVSIRQGGGGGRWGTRPPLSEFSGSAPAEAISLARTYEVTGSERVAAEFLILNELLPFFQRLLSELVTA